MLADLFRVLGAVVVVGVLPGYAWAAVLWPAVDRAERAAYGIGLSLALVPAVALVPARVFGLGVTLPVAAGSALLVLVAGLVARRVFGAAPAGPVPLTRPPGPLGAPVLVPVTVVAALVLWEALYGVPGGPLSVALVLLAVPAGIVYALTRGAEGSPEAESPAGDGGILRPLLLSGVLGLVLARGYVGPVLHDWPFVRGVDHYSHTIMANLMASEGEIEPYLIYPPGFHTFTAAVSRLSALDPLEVFPVLGPALLLLPAIALYAVARRLWGWECGVAAALLGGLLAGGPYEYLNDSMYPNLVAAQFLLVLAVGALAALCAPSARTGLVLAGLGSAVVLYHQVTSLYLALVLALVVLCVVPCLVARERRRGAGLLVSLALLGALSAVYAWDTYGLPGGLSEGSGDTGAAVEMAIGTQEPPDLGALIGTGVSTPVSWLGALGVLLLLADRAGRGGRERLPPALAEAGLLLWLLVLAAGSRTALSGFPERFGRDLGIPLALLAAFALVAVLRSLGARRTGAVFLAALAVVATGAGLGVRGLESLREAGGPSTQLVMTEEIAEAGRWLRENNTGGNIMVSPHLNQVPSRAMLALGGYSALQSFEPWQVENPRDLPPTGPGPALDVIWVMQNPDGERTRRTLRDQDIRYVVLYKSFPGRETVEFWRLFEDRPDLYETTFENGEVLIVRPREP